MQEIDMKPGISQLIIVQRSAQQPNRWAQTRRTEEGVGKPTQVNYGGSANATSQQKERACTMDERNACCRAVPQHSERCTAPSAGKVAHQRPDSGSDLFGWILG